MAATATANVFEAAQGTSDFLTDLLGSIGVGNVNCGFRFFLKLTYLNAFLLFFHLILHQRSAFQAPEKTITDVNLKILTKVVSFVPLRFVNYFVINYEIIILTFK